MSHPTLTLLLILAMCATACTESCDPSPPQLPTPHARTTLYTALQRAHNAATQQRTQHAHNTLHQHLKAALHTTLTTLRTAPRPIRHVLVIGDSMSGPVGVALRDLFQPLNIPLHFNSEGNDALHNWERTKFQRFDNALHTHPSADAVVIVMGTNDALHPTPKDLIPVIQRVERSIHPRACYWVGPPKLWTKDTGIADLLERTTQHCTHLDSRPIRFERGRDGWHPTRDGAETWAQHIFSWIQTHPPRDILYTPPP